MDMIKKLSELKTKCVSILQYALIFFHPNTLPSGYWVIHVPCVVYLVS